jgi:hypothetical protein
MGSRVRAAGIKRALVAVAALLCAAGGSAPATARPAAHARAACRAPRLTELTLTEARRLAAHAGCKLRLEGARLGRANGAEVQTVQRQSPAAGARASRVTLWLNPECFGSAAYGPELKEPVLEAGPTELVSGFYVVGGPLARFSSPGCRRPEPPPAAGTVEVLDPATGAVIARQTSVSGTLVQIPLAAGTYTIRGTFLDATVDEAHPVETQSVSIVAGYTVRQDFFLSVP